MNAIGIDAFKGKSTVAILQPMGEVVQTPIDISRDAVSLERRAYLILSHGENTRVVMEATGRYHEPVAMELHDHGILCPLSIRWLSTAIAAAEPFTKLRTTRKILSKLLSLLLTIG